MAVGLDSLPHLAYFIMPEISPWPPWTVSPVPGCQGPSPQRCGPFMPPGGLLCWPAHAALGAFTHTTQRSFLPLPPAA